MTPEELKQLRKRQRSRSIVMGLILAGLAVLFYGITIARMG